MLIEWHVYSLGNQSNHTFLPMARGKLIAQLRRTHLTRDDFDLLLHITQSVILAWWGDKHVIDDCWLWVLVQKLCGAYLTIG